MKSDAETVAEYLAALPEDRRKAIETVRKTIHERLDAGKSCVRFKTAEDLPLEVIGRAIVTLPMEESIRRAKEIRGGRKGRG